MADLFFSYFNAEQEQKAIHEGHKGARRKKVSPLPSCNFVSFVDRFFSRSLLYLI